jgi:hypothetical protein
MMIAFSPTHGAVIDGLFFQICRGKPQNPGLFCLWVAALL